MSNPDNIWMAIKSLQRYIDGRAAGLNKNRAHSDLANIRKKVGEIQAVRIAELDAALIAAGQRIAELENQLTDAEAAGSHWQSQLFEAREVMAERVAERDGRIAELKLEVATLKALCGYCPIHKAAPGENCLNDGQRACATRRES